MTISGYDKEAARDYLRQVWADVTSDGRRWGASAQIAHEAGVSESSVSRWRRGRDCPSPAFWPIIERHLDLPPGAIARAAGLPKAAVAREGAKAELERIEHEMAMLNARLEALRLELGKR